MLAVKGNRIQDRIVFSCPGCGYSFSWLRSPSGSTVRNTCQTCHLGFSVIIDDPGTSILAFGSAPPTVAPLPISPVMIADVGSQPTRKLAVAWFVFGVIAIVVSLSLQNLSFWEQSSLAVGSLVACAVLSILESSRRLNKERAEYEQRFVNLRLERAEAAIKEAKCLSDRLQKELTYIEADAARFSEEFKRAQQLVNLTRRELNERAYSSFWDNVQRSSSALSACQDLLRGLARRFSEYSTPLRRRVHSFPLPPMALERLPNVAPIADELRSLARTGETDFQFATILEHKKTQLAILQSGASVSAAIGDLASGMRTSLSDIREELVETRESNERFANSAQEELRSIHASTARSAAVDERVSRVIDKHRLDE